MADNGRQRRDRPSPLQDSAARLRPFPNVLWRLRPLQWLIVDINDWLIPFVGINFLWVLLSLTLVGLPPATAALHDVAYAGYRGIAPTPRAFFAHVRRRFWQAWRWGLANILILGTLLALGRTKTLSEIGMAVIAVSGALLVMAQFYFWAFMALQEEPDLRRALRNSIFTALGDLMYLTLYLALTLFILLPALLLVAPFLAIVPVLLTLLTTYSLIGWLQHRGILKVDMRDL